MKKDTLEVYRVRKMHWMLCGFVAYWGPRYAAEHFRSLAGGLFQHLRIHSLSLFFGLTCEDGVSTTVAREGTLVILEPECA